MEQQNPKIKFYVRRTFGEKLNATFDFIKQNWKPLLKYSTYFILPLCLIQAFFLNKTMQSLLSLMMMSDNLSMLPPDFLFNYLLAVFMNLLGGMLLISTVYTLMQLYNSREEGIANITFNDLKPHIFRNMGRYLLALLGLILFTIAIGLVLGTLVVIFPNIGVILSVYIVILIAYIPLSLMVPILIFEKINLWKALIKSLKLGFATWRGIFAIGFVIGIIYMIISGVVSLPLTVIYVVNSLLITSDAAVQTDPSAFYSIGMYLLGSVSAYGMYLSTILPTIAIAYQYAHANEKMNSVSVVDEIDNFENF
jgi:hypothetical protein